MGQANRHQVGVYQYPSAPDLDLLPGMSCRAPAQKHKGHPRQSSPLITLTLSLHALLHSCLFAPGPGIPTLMMRGPGLLGGLSPAASPAAAAAAAPPVSVVEAANSPSGSSGIRSSPSALPTPPAAPAAAPPSAPASCLTSPPLATSACPAPPAAVASSTRCPSLPAGPGLGGACQGRVSPVAPDPG
jgi:hypothetical protein